MAARMTDHPFTLARASEADINEIVQLQYNCFEEWIRRIFMGVHSPEDLPRCAQRFVEHMQNDPNDAWVKVMDKSTGRIVAASNWKVYVNGKTDGGVKDSPPEGLQGEDLEKSREIMEKVNQKKREANPGPFVRMLSILWIDHYTVVDDIYRSTHLLYRSKLSAARRRWTNAEMGL